ncbi:MAG: biotin--[acetyl-CoA-carboxylase] ligase [Cytophagaceae bacterium]
MYNIPANTLFCGQNLIYLPSCHSTNDIALQTAATMPAAEGTIIITSDQTAGKGQKGNKWESAPGKNLTFSLILKPAFISPLYQFDLNISVSLAVFETLTKYLGERVKIKWPNDIFYGNSKISGILIENTIKGQTLETAIIGIGVNVNQQVFNVITANSIFNITGKPHELNSIFHELCQALEKYYLLLREGKRVLLKEKYHRHMYKVGVPSEFSTNGQCFTGTITGTDDYGFLLVEVEGKYKRFNMKEISFCD